MTAQKDVPVLDLMLTWYVKPLNVMRNPFVQSQMAHVDVCVRNHITEMAQIVNVS